MLEKLREIIRKYTRFKEAVITGDTVIQNDLGLNSFEFVELICEVEEKFDVEIPDRSLDGFKTVKDVIDFLEGAINGAGETTNKLSTN